MNRDVCFLLRIYSMNEFLISAIAYIKHNLLLLELILISIIYLLSSRIVFNSIFVTSVFIDKKNAFENEIKRK